MEAKHTPVSEQQSAPVIKWPVFPELSRFNHAYWFRFILTEEESQLELRYKVWVRFEKQHSNTSAILSVDRISEVFINDESPSQAVDQLAYETGKIFCPLMIEIDRNAQYVGVHNYEQITERWQKIRPEAERRFSGAEVERFLAKMDEVVATKTKVDKLFENDLFLAFYFNTVYLHYTEEAEAKQTLSFPVGDYAPVSYSANISKCLNVKGLIEIVQVGKESEKENADSPDTGKPDQESTYTATFALDPATGCIREATAGWDFKIPNKRSIRLILYPLRVMPDKNEHTIWEETEKKKERGFFSALFGT